MGRKITILGMGPSGMRKADAIHQFVEGSEVWSLNNAMVVYPDVKFSRYFEMHAASYLKTWTWATGPTGERMPIEAYYQKLDALECPIMVGQDLPMIKRQEKIDFAALFAHFGLPGSGVYFLGSPSLMLVYALWQHDNGQTVDEIQSWGIDTSDPQHGQQRSSWAWWLCEAHHRKIKIVGSALDFFREYEKDDGLRGLRELTEKQLVERKQKDRSEQ